MPLHLPLYIPVLNSKLPAAAHHLSVSRPRPQQPSHRHRHRNLLMAPTPPEAQDRRSAKQRKKSRPPGSARPDAVQDIEDFSPAEALKLRPSLLRWYDASKRALPWRTTAAGEEDGVPEEDRAYAVWVSEVMLQQTRVAAVVGYYERWMARWPTVEHLACASQEEVNEMWAGLGYYRRARFLLEGAKSIVERGEFPRTATGLREVKGIGKYTAGAIASIAFNESVPVVDGNVIRVIARLKAISSNPKETATVKNIWKLAGQLVDPYRPGDFNQAIMELGATLCSVSSPGCSDCPVSDHCRAFALSRSCDSVDVTDYPVKVAKPKQRLEYAAVCIVEIVGGGGSRQEEDSKGNGNPVFLLVKRPDEGLLAGLWEFPSVLVGEGDTDRGARRRAIDVYLRESFGLDVGKNCASAVREDVGEYVHVFSHIRLRMYVELLILSLEGGIEELQSNGKQREVVWKCVEASSIEKMGLTSGVRKVYSMIQDFKTKKISSDHPNRASRKRNKIVH